MNRRIETRTLTGMAILTAVVVILQLLGSFIRFGVFSVSLVLIPIVVGAALYGALAGAWLGLVFGVVVLLTDSAAFMVVNPLGTILTVLLKGTLAGLVAGLVYRRRGGGGMPPGKHRAFPSGVRRLLPADDPRMGGRGRL